MEAQHSSSVRFREPSFARAASSMRLSIVSAVSHVEEVVEVGTVSGTALNTTCNVIGAGVLSLPLVAYRVGLVWAVLLTVALAIVGSFTVYVTFVGADRTNAFFLNDIFAKLLAQHWRRRRPLGQRTSGRSMARAGSATALDSPRRIRGVDEATTLLGGAGYPHALDQADEDPAMARGITALSLVVDLFVLLNNAGLLIVYARVIADSAPSVLRDFASVAPTSVWGLEKTWVVLPAIVFFVLTSVRNMEELKWSSILGIVTIFYAVGVIAFRYGEKGYQGVALDHQPVESVAPPRLMPGDDPSAPEVGATALPSKHGEHKPIALQKDTPQYRWAPTSVPLKNLAEALATLCVAYGYHYNAPIFYRELHDRTPRKMMLTVLIAYPVVTVGYLITAVFGYLSFAQHVADPSVQGQILNNYPAADALLNTVRLFMFVHLVCVYPVISVCVRHSLHRLLLILGGRSNEAADVDMPANVSRAAILAEALGVVATTSTVAYLYKNVGEIIALIGAVCGGNLMLTIPGVIGMCIWAAPVAPTVGEGPILDGAGRSEKEPSALVMANSDPSSDGLLSLDYPSASSPMPQRAGLAPSANYGGTNVTDTFEESHSNTTVLRMLAAAEGVADGAPVLPPPFVQHRRALYDVSRVCVVLGILVTVAGVWATVAPPTE